MTTQIIDAPAPWNLEGRGYVSMLRCPAELLDEGSFVPASLRGRRRPSPYAYLMFVDYARSPVGPYHELLFIPGSFVFEDGKRHWSISRIFVSSLDSVVNGNRNWGIPKEVAHFDVRYRDGRLDRVTLSKDGREFARLAFRHFPVGLPLWGPLIPASWRTLGQHDHGKTYLYTPCASSWVLAARLVEVWSDPAMFPDLSRARSVMTTYMPRFRMCFPEARVIGREIPPTPKF